MSTPDTMSEMEDRLRAALTARAEQVRPEHLAPLAPAVRLRPRWQSPWVLLASAAVVLLVLGVVLQGLGRDTRSDDVAPQPDEPEIQMPQDIGRDWDRNDLDRQPRLDLDGDGTDEKVVFRGEPTKEFDGRYRLETTLSSTGEDAYGIAEVGTTVATNVLDPIDADGDGDQELVLYYDDASAVGGGGYPLVFDLRDGLLVQAVPEDPDLLVRGNVPVPGSTTEFYEMVRIHDYWFEDGQLLSSRSRRAYASGNMSLIRTETILVDTWRWSLDEDGVLRAESLGCVRSGLEASVPCRAGEVEELPYLTPVATETFGTGESADFRDGYRFSARLEAFADPVLVVEGDDGRSLRHDDFQVADPRVATVQPMGVDGASLFVTSASDPSYVEVLAQDGDQLRALEAVGEIDLRNEGDVRTWLTQNGGVVTVTAQEDGSWTVWTWQVVRGGMTALPWGTVCFDDVDDPTTAHSC